MSDTIDTTPQAEPATQVIYAADVAVKFWPDKTTTAEVLFREEEPVVIDTDGTYITEPHDPANPAHAAAIDATTAANALLRCDMPLPLPGGAPRTVIVVVRHPDAENAFTVHGEPVRIIDIDLGGSFDMGHSSPGYGEACDAHDYADGLLEEIEDLPAGHPARREVEAVVQEIRDWAGPEEDA